jgi:hypothetical protein
VSHSVNELSRPPAADQIRTNGGLKYSGPVIAAMLVYTAVQFGIVGRYAGLLITMILSTLTYLLAVYLFNGIAYMAYRRQTWLLWGAGIAAAVIGYLVSGLSNVWPLLTGWSLVFLAGAVCGRLTLAGQPKLICYLSGIGVAALFAILMNAPIWSSLMHVATEQSDLLVDQFRGSLLAAGYGGAAANENAEQMSKLLHATIRLLPATTVMSHVLQFTIGYLWFSHRVNRETNRGSAWREFLQWKVPFGLMPGVIVVILLRLAGGEMLQLIADNILASVAIFYCVCGLALVEFFMRKLQMSRFMRVAFYLLLFLTQLIGFFVLALLGFVDSFTNWRRIPATGNSLANQ